MDKDQVAAVLENIATLLELKGESAFKCRAYTNAARALENIGEPLDKLIQEHRLREVPGIGDALEKRIRELVSTGRLGYYEALKASTPPGLVVMLDIAGLGPKKIKALHEELGVQTEEQLEQACNEGKVAKLKGFGAKSQTRICEAIQRRRSYAGKHLLGEALPLAEFLLERLRAHPAVNRCAFAGSLRRHCEVIGHIDLLASSKEPSAALSFFCEQPGVVNIQAKGETTASIIFEGGMQVDLRVVSDPEFATALLYFTGSKEHNVVMSQRAIARGLRLTEYGLFRSETETRDPQLRVASDTEEELFAALGLHPIPPELRENHLEFEAAEEGPLPRLLEWTDLRGSLHNHSTWSDGHQTLEQIARSMEEFGLEYWAITDHSRSSIQANGLDSTRLERQLDEVIRVNAMLESEGSAFRLLTGVEVDILKDGRLDLPDELLARLDVVIASIHQGFGRESAENTARLVAAANNRYVHTLGHLTGRLLLEREPNPVDHAEVIEACARTGTWIELNASPKRLDMDYRFWPLAKHRGVKCVINCDAHWLEQTWYLRLGAGMARKGWLTRRDVVNTLSLERLREALALKRNSRGWSKTSSRKPV